MKPNHHIEVLDELTPERRTAVNTQDYRLALSRQGPLAGDWADKPHRLIYDLCREVDRLREHSEELVEALEGVVKLIGDDATLGESDYVNAARAAIAKAKGNPNP